LVLALVGRFVDDFYLLCGLALVLMAIEFPSARSIAAMVHTAERETATQ
jgi:hypothetical protein